MKHIKYIFILVLVSACSKYLDVPAPTNSLTSSTAYSSQSTIQLLMNGMYSYNAKSGLYSFGNTFPTVASDQMSDNYYNPNLNSFANGFQACTFTPSGLNAGGLHQWDDFYLTIYNANGLTENLPNVSADVLSTATKNSYLGAAYTWRAWNYWNLANIWGGVPLVLSTQATENKTLPRAALTDVYAQIEKDLKQAILLLPATGAGNPTIIDTQAIPQAILSELYLTTGNYSDAEKMATAVINSGNGYILQTDLTQVFLRNAGGSYNQETIFSYGPSALTGSSLNQDKVALGKNYLRPFRSQLTSRAAGQLSPSLLAEFETGDNRKTNWTTSISFLTDGSLWVYKYKKDAYSASVDAGEEEDWINIRLAEVYLNRAEARAQLGNISGAADDVNKIRERAGLADVTATTQSGMLAAILHERRVELFGEDKYWNDIRRFGVADQRLSAVSYKSANYKPYMKFMPLTISTLASDPYFTQTPGY